MDGTVEAQTMTEVTPTPAPEAPAEVTQETPPPNGHDPARPEGFDPVDVKTATPEQIEARINRLYGNLKKNEKEAREARQANEILIQRFQELQQGQQQIVQHIQTNDYQETENTLRQQMRAAWDRGDVDGYHATNEKLLDIKAEKAAQAKIPKQQKPIETNNLQQNRAISATEALEMSVASGETPPDKANILRAYFGEADPYGNLKRPWVNVSDVRNSQASKIGAVVFDPEHPVFSQMTFKQQLAEMDRQMGVANTQPQSNSVLPAGNLTGMRKTSTVKLSPQEETIAVRTKFGGPKAKSDADHKAAYLQAKIKHGGR